MFGNIGKYKIRLIEEEDMESLYRAMDINREFLFQYLDFVKDLDRDCLAQAIKNWQALYFLSRGFRIGIFDDGNECYGMASVKIDTYDNRGEIGYWLVEKATGQGLMTEAIRRICQACFDHYKLNKFTIKCIDSNEKSKAIAKRLGFSYEACLREEQRLNGEYRDLLVFSLLKSSWIGHKGD